MSPDLRDSLHDLADAAPRIDLDPSAWDRGRRRRRRDRIVAGAAALAIVAAVGGLASLALGPPRALGPAGDVVPDGAIPSEILEPPGPDLPALEDDMDIGPASVAFVSMNGAFPEPFATVIGATDGRYHFLALPGLDQDRKAVALSPDGNRLAWRTEDDALHVADLGSGAVTDLPWADGARPVSWELQWMADSTHLAWSSDRKGGVIDVTTGEEVTAPSPDPFVGLPVSPDGSMAASPSSRAARASSFVTRDPRRVVRRALPADLYPNGAAVEPLGWADDHLIVARVFGPEGSYAEGYHLVLFTSPDRPESEWTYRILMRDVPSSDELTIAVDLIPDLDGTSSQQLTHDFGEPEWPAERDISWIIGLGVAAAIAVLLGLRRLWRRLRAVR